MAFTLYNGRATWDRAGKTAATAAVTNEALNKAATQVSTYSTAVAGFAVDGNTDGAFWNGSVTHTVTGAHDWWQVDLGSAYALEKVKVWNRTDCCGDRLANFYVFVSDQPFSSYDLTTTLNQSGVSNYYTAGQGGTPTYVNVNRSGRYVRVQLSSAGIPLSLAEVEVLGSTVATANINWLVTDQLGTPRMIFDQSGALATTKRHDYLPFGEELAAGQGVRNTTPGYGGSDGVRQKFTSKERDIETGLDYFIARYYSSNQGRFTSSDPLLASARPSLPQSWNRYGYVLNNPLRLIDPNGLADDDPQKPKGEGQQGQKGTGVCGQVKIEAKVDQKPTMVENQTIPVNGQPLKVTGVEGKIVFTVKVNGQPTADVQVTESNQTTTTRNGNPVPSPTVPGTASTNADGQFVDTVGLKRPTDGTKVQNEEIKSDYSKNTWTLTNNQTLNLTLPGGSTCSATNNRVLTNDGRKGPSSTFTLTTTQPVVKKP